MYFRDHKKTVVEGAVLKWIMQGPLGRQAGIEVNLKVHFVRLPDGREGITLDVVTDDAVRVTALQPEYDTVQHQGQVVWLKGRNGVVLEFEGDPYLLFQVEEVVPDQGGVLCFYVLPTASGDGVNSDDHWLE